MLNVEPPPPPEGFAPFAYCAGEETGFEEEAEAVEGGPEENPFVALGSAKKSDGENASGLLWCEGESPLWFDRAIDGVFFRTGRIQGGRVTFA